MTIVLRTLYRGAKSFVSPFIQPIFVTFLYWTLASLGTIMSVWTTGDRIQDESELLHPFQPKRYDFIIVGAGSAGCLLANRLSRRHSVLLIEAGGEPNPLQFIPGFSLFFTNFPELDWQHRSVPQKYGTLMSVNGESSWSTGRGLGGTGNLNYSKVIGVIHLRGHRQDFDNWAKITGDPSWSWEGVLPFFKSYENYEVPGDSVNHGYSGDLRIEAPDHPQSAFDFVRAGGELGYPNVDLNAPFTEGFDIIRYPMLRGVRQAPYLGLLHPVRKRPTLTIVKFAQVNKILFRNGNEAYGVEYDRHGMSYMAHATREVIVSAGTVGSPKLLMLSGVGPSSHLQDLNIPVVSDLEVGKNLQDHLGVYLAPFFVRPGVGYFLDRDLTLGQFIKWFALGTGRLSNSGCEATGLFSSSISKGRGEGDWPDIEIFSYSFTNFQSGVENYARLYNLKLDDVQQYLGNDVGRDSIYIALQGSRPLSRGYIQLGGSSPYDKLIIDPNYLGDPGEVDLKVLLEGVKKSVYLMENTTAGGVNLGARFTTTRLPGCEHLEFRSDAYWICFIRRFSVTLHHPVGTCSMGSVVDTQLKVVGTKNLRVIDASIQPTIVTTNTQASTLMIAEKGADMILRYWNSQQKKNNNNFNKNNYNYKNNNNQYNQFGGNKKNPLYGNGGGTWGNKRGNGLWYANTNNNLGVILEAPVGGGNFLKVGQNTTVGISNPDIQLKTLRGIGLQGDAYPDYSHIQPVPSKHKVPNYQDAEREMMQKLTQSFEQLKMVSEIAKENYNSNLFGQQQQPQQQLQQQQSPGISTQKPYGGINNDFLPNLLSSQNGGGYYDEGYASGNEGNFEEDFQQTKPLVPSPFATTGKTANNNENGIPRPAAPPQPPRAFSSSQSRRSPLHSHGNKQYYDTPELSQTPQPAFPSGNPDNNQDSVPGPTAPPQPSSLQSSQFGVPLRNDGYFETPTRNAFNSNVNENPNSLDSLEEIHHFRDQPQFMYS